MALQARYHVQSDRMQISLQSEDEGGRSYWITRRQWMGLLHALSVLPESQVTPVNEMPRPKVTGTLSRIAMGDAVPVDVIRLRRVAGGIKIMFLAGDESLVFARKNEGIGQLKDMLLQQAERAEWDVGAALARLAAQDKAKLAVRKASGA